MFLVSNVERNIFILLGILIVFLVRFVGFGGYDMEFLVERMNFLSFRVIWWMVFIFERLFFIVWCFNSCVVFLVSWIYDKFLGKINNWFLLRRFLNCKSDLNFVLSFLWWCVLVDFLIMFVFNFFINNISCCVILVNLIRWGLFSIFDLI